MKFNIDVKDIRSTIKSVSSRAWFKRPLNEIRLIAIHHQGANIIPDKYDEIGMINSDANYHIERNWGVEKRARTLAYHFVVSRSGKVYWCNDLESIVWHANDANRISLGIELQGNFQKQYPSNAQIKGLYHLLNELVGNPELRIKHSDVYGHKELKGITTSLKYGKFQDFGNYTSCPAFANRYAEEYRKTGDIKVAHSGEDKPDVPNAIEKFYDILSGEWYTPYAKTMIDAGVMKGFDDKTWRPGEPVTRAQLAKIMVGSMLKMKEILDIYDKYKK